LEEQKRSDSITIAALVDLSVIQDEGAKRSLSEIFQSCLLLNSKLRWDIKRVDAMFSEMVLSIPRDALAEEQPKDGMNKSIEAKADNYPDDDEEDDDDDDDLKIEQVSLGPFGSDVSPTSTI